MSTRSSRTQPSTSRSSWDADIEFDDDVDIDAAADSGMAELDDPADADELEFDRRPRRPARTPAKGSGGSGGGGGKRAERERRKARAAAVTDEFGDDDELDPEIDELLARKERERRRATTSEPFKCRHCRAFIGMPPTGGSQRNHCPMCLYSLHVDLKTPGDRASDCRSLMEPVGSFYRLNLEQVVVHRCLGCGFQRYNRIAADDNPVLLASLPIVDPPAQASWDDG